MFLSEARTSNQTEGTQILEITKGILGEDSMSMRVMGVGALGSLKVVKSLPPPAVPRAQSIFMYQVEAGFFVTVHL